MLGKLLGGRYEIIEKLGMGGMAVVYKARCTWLDRIVTVKILREELVHDDDFVRRFRKEAQAVARLSHPNIVSVYDAGSEDQIHYIVMEYIEGKTLKDVIREEGRLDPEKAMDFASQICAALEHAHENNIIHRDIKPQNILITPRGQVKVTDFGIAQATAGTTLTHPGKIMGSVHYFSPEQARGETVGVTSDLYSVGAVLYEMLTGKVPFEGESPISVALKHLQEPTVPLRVLVPSIPLAIEQVVLRALNKNPAARFSSARELSNALQAALQGEMLPVPLKGTELEVGPEEPGFFRRKFFNRRADKNPASATRRVKPMLWLAGAAILVLLLIGFYFLWQKLIIVPEIVVPSVQGELLEDALVDLERAGFRGTVTGQQYNNDVGKNRVISQEPLPNALAKKGRAIQLITSLGAQMGNIPNVKGKNLNEANILISNAGFKIGSIEPVYTAQYPVDEIISQIPASDTPQPLGTMINLIVSKGPEAPSVQLTNLLGMRLEVARTEIARLGMVVGTVTEKESSSYFVGQVMEQDTPAGTLITPGALINLVVSKGPGPTPRTAAISIRVPNTAGSHEVVIIVEDRKDRREDYRRIHSAGEQIKPSVRYYGSGKIQVYIDGQLIQEKTVG